MHVCTINDSASDMQEKDERFVRYADLIRSAMEHVRTADVSAFFARCGSGHTDWFDHNDGSIDVGYRISKRPFGGSGVLDLSLCHIYYGK
jgi:hypothetical protein